MSIKQGKNFDKRGFRKQTNTSSQPQKKKLKKVKLLSIKVFYSMIDITT